MKLMYQVESVMAKLGIERRVQYGAEKMLDVSRILVNFESWKLTCLQVIEQRSGNESAEMKERITAQLESAADKIRELEEKLERLRGGEC
jgi:rapamycin-insensitive companion of mTOR